MFFRSRNKTLLKHSTAEEKALACSLLDPFFLSFFLLQEEGEQRVRTRPNHTFDVCSLTACVRACTASLLLPLPSPRAKDMYYYYRDRERGPCSCTYTPAAGCWREAVAFW